MGLRPLLLNFIVIMKKVFLMAAVVLASTALNTAWAGKKKDKKKAETPQETVLLKTSSDSLSYAGGLAATRGLLPYLQQRMHVDTAYMADFVKGYRELLARKSDPEFIAYLAGAQIAQQANTQIFPGMSSQFKDTNDTLSAEMFHKGFLAGVQPATALMADTTAQKFYENRAKADREKVEAAYKAKNEQWLAENAKKPGVQTLPSGLQYKVITEGTGATPQATDEVNVVYEGKLIDGTVFDATKNHGGTKTDKFRCDQVIKGWTEALTKMPVGSTWEIYIPQNLAYGSRQAGQIKPYSTLIFNVQLVSIEPKKEEAKAADTKTTATAKANKAVKTTKATVAKSKKTTRK